MIGLTQGIIMIPYFKLGGNEPIHDVVAKRLVLFSHCGASSLIGSIYKTVPKENINKYFKKYFFLYKKI